MKKWFISGLVVVALLATTGLLIKKSVRAEIVINASQKEVWRNNQPSDLWGLESQGFALITKALKLKDTRRFSSSRWVRTQHWECIEVSVEDFVPNEWMHQSWGYPVILTYDHNWHLEAVPEGTKVTQYEYYTGLYVLFWDPTPARLLYKAGNKNLKARLETN